ncbi:flagellin FliC, partial [bacterium]|nr:flagellin FliC [bacterium]
SVNIENLTSSRSTLQDADVAKESSNFIKSQILQQASATLLATANQTPSLALRLLGAM